MARATLRAPMRRQATALLATLVALLPIVTAAANPEAPGPESRATGAASATPPESPASQTAPAAPPDRGKVRMAPSWFALPVPFWLPETRLGLGAAGGFHFHVGNAERASSVLLVGAFTMLRQASLDLAADVNLPRGIVLGGRARAVNYPDSFYGIGPDSQAEARELYTRRFAEAVLYGEYPILNHRLRAGVRLDVRGEGVREVQSGGVLASDAVPGTHGFAAVGLGGEVTWDTRDEPLYPSRGSLVQAWVLGYPRATGGGHGTFTRGSLEGRKFLPLGRGRVLGLAGFVDQASDDTPFTLLPKIGSVRFLRGWREGRFRDRLAWAAQAELRLPLLNRIFGAAFGAVGDVARNLGALRADTLKAAGGIGLRYRLTDAGVNLRLDLAASRDGPEVYLILLEAF